MEGLCLTFQGLLSAKRPVQPNGRKTIRKNARLIMLVTKRLILKRYALRSENITLNILSIEKNDISQSENGAKHTKKSSKPIIGNIASKIMWLSQLIIPNGELKILIRFEAIDVNGLVTILIKSRQRNLDGGKPTLTNGEHMTVVGVFANCKPPVF